MWQPYSMLLCFHSQLEGGKTRRNISCWSCQSLVCVFLITYVSIWIHILDIAGFLVPLPSVIATISQDKHGYIIAYFPPHFCIPNDSTVTFYTVVLVDTIMIVFGLPLLFIVAWTLTKVRLTYLGNVGTACITPLYYFARRVNNAKLCYLKQIFPLFL